MRARGPRGSAVVFRGLKVATGQRGEKHETSHEVARSRSTSVACCRGCSDHPIGDIDALPDGNTEYALGIQILMVMTVLTLLPAMLITMTAFTRILIVLAILRQALGAQTPSNQIILGLSLFLTLFIMAPVLDLVWLQSLSPYMDGQLSFQEALNVAQGPLREFMFAQTRESDLAMFAELGVIRPLQVAWTYHCLSVAPFLTSELKTAFQIGFLLFVPFLVIDLVVAAVLMSMGMMMLSPIIISLPFKLMLFVLIDGWSLISATLVSASRYRERTDGSGNSSRYRPRSALVGCLLAGPMLGVAPRGGSFHRCYSGRYSDSRDDPEFHPKLLSLVVVLFLVGPWMLRLLVTFSERLFLDIPGLVG